MHSATLVFLKNKNQAYAARGAMRQTPFQTCCEGGWVACACVAVFSL